MGVLTVMTAVAVPPGSTPAGGENEEAERVKFCVCAAAKGKLAAANKSNRPNKMVRLTCLEFNMGG